MTAKEMFEELGYEKFEVIKYLEYSNDLNEITYWKNDKTIAFELKNKLTEKLVQAINKQIEELRWNNE